MASKGASSPSQPSLLPPDAEPQEDPFKQFLVPHKTIRIAVSGDVYVTRVEKDIIDTPDFQRLRGIRQLGNVQHVYPTALHTRFDHSLGTLCMADRMIQAIKNNMHSEADERKIDTKQEILARLYALLHDLTHVPFGHTIENELGLLTEHDHNPTRILHFLGPGSDIWRIITNLGDELYHKTGNELYNTLGNELYNRFMAIYIWDEKKSFAKRVGENEAWDELQDWKIIKSEDAFIHDLVSNTVCADLLDYIARDNYFCNLGGSMEYRFINFLYLSTDSDDRRHVFVRLWKKGKNIPRRDTLTDLARLLEARYLLAERAYFHHAKIISGCMLGRALQDMMIAGHLKEEDLYEHTDDTLIRAMTKSDVAATTARLAKALTERKLYYIAKVYEWEDFEALQAHDHRGDQEAKVKSQFIDPNARWKLENTIAEEIGADPGDVLIYAPPRPMNSKAAEMRVEWKGQAKRLRDIDDPIMQPRLKQIIDSHEMLWKLYIFANHSLTAPQKRLLLRACEIHFVCPNDTRTEKVQEYYEAILAAQLEELKVQLTPSSTMKALSAAASELQTISTDKHNFRARCRAAIEKHFKTND